MNKKFIVIILIVASLFLVTTILIRNFIVNRSLRKLAMIVDRINAIYEYGTILYSKKDLDKAVRAFKIVAKQDVDPVKRKDALIKLTDIYNSKNKLLETRYYYKELVRNFPNSDSISEIQKKLEDINIKILFSALITEDSLKYQIKPNDTLSKIAMDHRTTVMLLKRSNNLKNDIIIPGKFLKVTKARFNILVDKSQNLLFLKKDGEIIKTYSVSTGLDNSTPVGKFKIEEKLVSPVWYKIGAVVSPDSPEYELGKYWMGISEPGYGIHGTNDPGSIGKHITKGCVRMLDEDIEELYTIVPSGIQVVIVD